MLTTLSTVIKPLADKIKARHARVVHVSTTHTTRLRLMATSRGHRHSTNHYALKNLVWRCTEHVLNLNIIWRLIVQVSALCILFSVSHVQYVSDLRPKFTLTPHRVWKYGRHPICGGWE